MSSRNFQLNHFVFRFVFSLKPKIKMLAVLLKEHQQKQEELKKDNGSFPFSPFFQNLSILSHIIPF